MIVQDVYVVSGRPQRNISNPSGKIVCLYQFYWSGCTQTHMQHIGMFARLCVSARA